MTHLHKSDAGHNIQLQESEQNLKPRYFSIAPLLQIVICK